MFSIVIPLYNKQESIRKTIESVLDQDFQDFEIVIVDDGSTDASVEKVLEVQDERIRLLRKPNGGVSSARNRGIKEARFEWIAFLDGDDLWSPTHLTEIIRMMNKYPQNMIYATSFKFSDDRKVFRHTRQEEISIVRDYFREALKEPILWTGIVVLNRCCFSEVKTFNTKLSRGEDVDLWGRLARRYDIVKSTRITATYRIEAENRSDKQYNLERSSLYHYEIDFFSKDEYGEYLKKNIRKYLKAFLRRGDFRTILRLIKRYNFKLLFR